MASCAVCGKEVPVESKFCVHCGNAMESPLANSKSPTTAELGTPSQSVSSAAPNTTPTDRGLVMRGVGSTAGFALLYAVLMVPTYVLPYFGSNSAIVGALGAAIGKGLMPQTWAHIWFLTLLILVAWMRGATVHKGFLPAISFCAALFDMTPVLNVIPLAPTVLHIVTLAIGVSGKAENSNGTALRKTGRQAVLAATAMTLMATAGSILFMMTAQKGIRSFGAEIAKPTVPSQGFKAWDIKPAAPVQQQAQPGPVQAPTPPPATAPAPSKAVVEPTIPNPVAATRPQPVPVSPAAKLASTPVAKQLPQPSPPQASNPNKAAIAAMLSDANACLASKRYDCAVSNAKSVLRLDPANFDAAQIQQRANAAEKQALQSISIR